MLATLPLLEISDFPPLQRRAIEILQVNLGYRCNQSCLHCHVNAGPQRKEEMTSETIDALIDFIAASPEVKVLDLTGGAPELNPHFRHGKAAGYRYIMGASNRWSYCQRSEHRVGLEPTSPHYECGVLAAGPPVPFIQWDQRDLNPHRPG